MNRIAVTACVALGTIGTFAAATSGAQAKSKNIFTERDLVVTLVTPTLNQEVLPDLGDPGLGNVITVRFSSVLHARDLIDPQNVVNSLSPKVEFLNSTFLRLPGIPNVRQNVFTFNPFLTTPALAQGQYTLNLKSSIRNRRGRLLNGGGPDYTTTFSVGTDIYAPVLRRVSPVHGQIGIGLLQSIIATFNEPLNPSKVVSTVTVTNANTNPPTPIPGKGAAGGLSLARNGFDLVFTPDPCFGYPPKASIQMQIQGNNFDGTIGSTVSDQFNNSFTRDAGLQWTLDPVTPGLYHSPNGSYDFGTPTTAVPYSPGTGIFTLQFQTKGIKPQPQALRPSSAMNVHLAPGAAICSAAAFLSPSCALGGDNLYYTTANGLGQVSLQGFIAKFNQGTTKLEGITLVPNTPVSFGRPGGLTFDRRQIGFAPPPAPARTVMPTSFHTFIYMVNEKTGTVDVVRSDNFQVLGRLSGFQSPRDVSQSLNTSQIASSLYVSNFGSNEVVAVNLDGIKVSFTGQPDGTSPCDAIRDNVSQRAFIPVGSGPTDVSADGFMNSRVMVTNSLESSMSIIDVRTNKVLKSYDTGSNPVSSDWIMYGFGFWNLAVVACQGGLNDPNGSLSLYMRAPPLQLYYPALAQSRDGIEGTLTDGVRNPTHVWGVQEWEVGGYSILTPGGGVWTASNTGGRTALVLAFSITGVFGLSITPSVVATIDMGSNPSSTAYDAYYPNYFLFSSVLGTGSLMAVDQTRSLAPVPTSVPGIRKLWTCFSH